MYLESPAESDEPKTRSMCIVADGPQWLQIVAHRKVLYDSRWDLPCDLGKMRLPYELEKAN